MLKGLFASFLGGVAAATFSLIVPSQLAAQPAEETAPPTDIPAQIQERLLRDGHSGQHWHIVVGPPQVVGIKTVVSDAVPSPIPGGGKVSLLRMRNCTSKEQKKAGSIQLTTRKGYSTQIKKGFTQVTGLNLSLKVSGKVFGGEIGASQTITIDMTKTETETQETAEVKTEEISQTVQPFRLITVRAQETLARAYVDFQGLVLVDAPLTVVHTGGGMRPANENFMLSKLYPKEADRTFVATGRVWAFASDDVDIYFREDKLDPNNPKHCPPVNDISPEVWEALNTAARAAVLDAEKKDATLPHLALQAFSATTDSTVVGKSTNDRVISVEEAAYGDHLEGKTCDAKSAVSQCNGKTTCSFEVTDSLCAVNTAAKNLHVTWNCGVPTPNRTRAAARGTRIELSCES
jgi:hypothetical protein